MTARDLLRQAEQLIDAGRPVPALRMLDQAMTIATVPAERLLATYNRGVVAWDKLGDGVAARTALMRAAALEGPEYAAEQLTVMRAGALENLMLSALSYGEFDTLSRRLAALAPSMPVLGGLPPQVKELRERGAPWSDMLIQLAMTNYHRNDPRLDRGRYGVAKATYQLVLVHRRELRLSREDWHLVMYEYIALSQRMAADYMNARGGDSDGHSPEEYLPVLTEALPLVDDYLRHCPGDRRIRKLRSDVQFVIGNARRRWAAASREVSEEMTPASETAPALRCGRCGSALADPRKACARCGLVNLPSPLATGLALSVALLAGWFAWRQLESSAVWLRGGAVLLSAFVTLTVMAPFVAWFSQRRK